LTSDTNKEGYPLTNASKRRASRVIGLGLVSAASALAGGLAVAWWYRKTLTKLQNPIGIADLQKFELQQTEDEILSQPSPGSLRSNIQD
jgi:hypothetical protein